MKINSLIIIIIILNKKKENKKIEKKRKKTIYPEDFEYTLKKKKKKKLVRGLNRICYYTGRVGVSTLREKAKPDRLVRFSRDERADRFLRTRRPNCGVHPLSLLRAQWPMDFDSGAGKNVSGIALRRGGGGGGGKRTRWRVFNDNSSYLLAAHAVQSCVPPLFGIHAGKSTDLRRPQIGSRALAG